MLQTWYLATLSNCPEAEYSRKSEKTEVCDIIYVKISHRQQLGEIKEGRAVWEGEIREGRL
jgi:hypothetical protein